METEDQIRQIFRKSMNSIFRTWIATFIIFIAIMIGCYIIGLDNGRIQERVKIKKQILEQKYAPGPITIGDSIYIVRYYPL